MRVPAALVALPLVAGAAAGILLHGSTPERLILASAGAAVLCALAGLAFFADGEAAAVVCCVVGGSGLAGLSLGGSATSALLAPPLLAWFESLPAHETGPFDVAGVLRDDAVREEYGVLLTLDVSAVAVPGGTLRPARGGVRLVVGGTAPAAEVAQWVAGRAIRASAALRRPAFYANPGVPDERRAQSLRGVALVGSVKSAALVGVTARGGRLTELAAVVRAWTRRVIALHVGAIDARSAGVATAILIGDRTGLSGEDEQRLKDAGTYHVIAISGGNIAILAALLIGGARAVRLPYRAAASLSILALLFYGEVAGGTPSVGRAITAAVVFLAALLLDHRGSPLNVIAVAAVLAVAVRPATPADGGFLLSFGATAGILLGVPRMPLPRAGGDGGWRRVAGACARAVAGVAAATLCAETALAPVAATLFSRITVAGLVLNFAAIPLMTLVQCGSLALLAVAGLSDRLAASLAAAVHWSAWALVESARLVESAPWMVRDVRPPAPWLSAVYYVSATVALFASRLRRYAGAALVVSGLAIAGGPGLSPVVERAPAGPLRVVVLDVGQGDATIATLPGGHAILVDAGGLAGTTFDIAGQVVLPAVRALGVGRLHALVVTHGDPDHAGGAATVLRRLPVANVWEGTPVPPHPVLRELAGIARARGSVWRSVRPGDVERSGGAEVRVLHPPPPDWERQRVRNDDSVVLELRYGDVSIVLPGDIGREGEAAVRQRFDPAPIVILKAAHHGSATSSGESFLDATRPRAAIFSAGRNNRFGHPAPAVVDRFARRGVPIFNTASDGAVFVETDGRSVTLSGWLSGRRLVISREGDPP